MRTYLRPDATAIRRRRIFLGFTQRDLAEKAGLSHGYIAMLEKGERDRCTLGALGQIADALGVGVEELSV
jgi:transcriptional regulator with XRE-family HTH domain